MAVSVTGTAMAQEAHLIGKLSAGQRKAVIESWDDPKRVIRSVKESIPEFKAPAIPATRCYITENGIEGFPLPGSREECPKKLPFEVPGQTGTVDLPATCVGPDDDGYCNCEIATSKWRLPIAATGASMRGARTGSGPFLLRTGQTQPAA